jgi:hypothetical protein
VNLKVEFSRPVWEGKVTGEGDPSPQPSPLKSRGEGDHSSLPLQFGEA